MELSKNRSEKKELKNFKVTRIVRYDKTYQLCPYGLTNLVQIALLSITACSHGLNLTAAGTVVFAELYWVPGMIVQAEDRCHRIGTEYTTIDVHYLVAEVRRTSAPNHLHN